MMWNLFVCAFILVGQCDYVKEAQHETLEACINDAQASSMLAGNVGYNTMSLCVPVRQSS